MKPTQTIFAYFGFLLFLMQPINVCGANLSKKQQVRADGAETVAKKRARDTRKAQAAVNSVVAYLDREEQRGTLSNKGFRTFLEKKGVSPLVTKNIFCVNDNGILVGRSVLWRMMAGARMNDGTTILLNNFPLPKR